MNERYQFSTSHPMTFLHVSSGDHINAITGGSPTVTISKNGNAFSASSGGVYEVGNGWYALSGNAVDRNTLGEFILHSTLNLADPCDRPYVIVPFNPFNGFNLALTGLPPTAYGTPNGLSLLDNSTGITISTRHDVYYADINFTRDNNNTKDEYTCLFFRNADPMMLGPATGVMMSVFNRTNGSLLINPVAMTHVGTAFAAFKYDESTNRQASGEAYIVVVSGVLDGVVKSWPRVLGRDS